MLDFLIPFLISTLMGIGVGGISASFLEGGGPQRTTNGLRLTSKAVEGVFYRA